MARQPLTDLSGKYVKMLIDNLLTQPALLGGIAQSQTLPAPVCNVQTTPSQLELLLQFAPVLHDSSELLMRMQVLAALVSHISLEYTGKQYLELAPCFLWKFLYNN